MKVFALGLILILSACAQNSQVITAVPDQNNPAPGVSESTTGDSVLIPPPPPNPASEQSESPAPEQQTIAAQMGADPPAANDTMTEKRLEKVQAGKTLLEVIREQGIPDDNIIPGRKEQIAVYQLTGKYQFFFFRESQLISQGEYPRSTIEKMRQDNLYPQTVIRELQRL